MEIKKFDELVVESIAGDKCDGPSEVDTGTNMASTVTTEDSATRQKKVMLAVLNHCKASKAQNEALKIG